MTITLLDNAFAPITFTCGFLESSFSDVADTFSVWRKEIDKEFGTQTDLTRFAAPLAEALLRLEPLTSPLDRYLIVDTRSPWTAIFSNGLRVNDVDSPVSYLPTVLKCRGLGVSNVPDRSDTSPPDGLQIWGSVVFTLYGPSPTDWLNRIRHIAVSNDVGGWQFVAQGQIQPFEEPKDYQKRKIVDRFTPQMLQSYCEALGVQVFDADYYGGECLLSHIRRTTSPGPSMSISEARSRLYL